MSCQIHPDAPAVHLDGKDQCPFCLADKWGSDPEADFGDHSVSPATLARIEAKLDEVLGLLDRIVEQAHFAKRNAWANLEAQATPIKPPWDGCENKCPQCEERTPAPVVELDDYRPGWRSGFCYCANCGHQWVGVVHPEALELQCPKCRTMWGRLQDEGMANPAPPANAGKSLSSALDYLNGINAGLHRLDPERAPGDPELVPVPPPRGEP